MSPAWSCGTLQCSGKADEASTTLPRPPLQEEELEAHRSSAPLRVSRVETQALLNSDFCPVASQAPTFLALFA